MCKLYLFTPFVMNHVKSSDATSSLQKCYMSCHIPYLKGPKVCKTKARGTTNRPQL